MVMHASMDLEFLLKCGACTVFSNTQNGVTTWNKVSPLISEWQVMKWGPYLSGGHREETISETHVEILSDNIASSMI
jgi:hypothetical protein